jgi:hypothetical protein
VDHVAFATETRQQDVKDIADSRLIFENQDLASKHNSFPRVSGATQAFGNHAFQFTQLCTNWSVGKNNYLLLYYLKVKQDFSMPRSVSAFLSLRDT